MPRCPFAVFRAQVARLMQLLPLVPAPVFQDHVNTMLAMRDNIMIPLQESFANERQETIAQQVL